MFKPGSEALVEIRPYTEDDWVADGERTFTSGEEFVAYLGACPSHPNDASIVYSDASRRARSTTRGAARPERAAATHDVRSPAAGR